MVWAVARDLERREVDAAGTEAGALAEELVVDALERRRRAPRRAASSMAPAAPAPRRRGSASSSASGPSARATRRRARRPARRASSAASSSSSRKIASTSRPARRQVQHGPALEDVRRRPRWRRRTPTRPRPRAAAARSGVRMPACAATAGECSGPPPPNAAQAKRRGSSPRSRLIRRTRSAILASTTVEMPAAVSIRPRPRRSASRPTAFASQARVELHAAAEVLVRVDEPEHDVGVGDRRLGAAEPVARRSRTRPGALRSDVQPALVVDPRDAAAAGADRLDVEHRQRHRVALEDGDVALERRGRRG